MRILLDKNVPYRLRNFLRRHTVETAHERGWGALNNGDLLKSAEAARFDVLVTADQNLAYQQSAHKRSIALVVLDTNNWNALKHEGSKITAAVNAAKTAPYTLIEFAWHARRPSARRRS